MARNNLDIEMCIEKYQNQYLMRDDKITYELRKYNLSELTQKFLFGIMYKISADFIEPVSKTVTKSSVNLEYELTFKELKKELNINSRPESDKRKIEKLTKELVSTPISINVFDDKSNIQETVETNIIEKVVIGHEKEKLYIHIDERILPLYKATADKFTLWGFEYISYSEKKYTPRLYELLIEFTKSIGTKNIDGIISKTIDLDDLKYELSIPKSYQYGMIKERIIETCKEEFLALDIDNEKREHIKLFKSFEYKENTAKSRGKGRKAIESITFQFELLEKTKGLLRGKKGEDSINDKKIEKRSEESHEFYYSVGNIVSRVSNRNLFIHKLTENINDFSLRVLDIKNETRDLLMLDKIQDVAFEKALTFTLENAKTINIEEFEYNFRRNLEKNIEHWSKRTGKGKAQIRN